MSVRLNNDHRTEILNRMLRHRFAQDVTLLTNSRAKLAAAVYKDVYCPGQRELMADLPEGWLPKSETISVKFGQTVERLYFNGDLQVHRKFNHNRYPRVISGATPKRVSFLAPFSGHGTCVKVYDATHRLAVRFEKLDHEVTDLAKSIDEAKAKIVAALENVTTTGRLREEWPECEPFLKGIETPKAPLPAIPTASLNTMLDLPVEEAA